MTTEVGVSQVRVTLFFGRESPLAFDARSNGSNGSSSAIGATSLNVVSPRAGTPEFLSAFFAFIRELSFVLGRDVISHFKGLPGSVTAYFARAVFLLIML